MMTRRPNVFRIAELRGMEAFIGGATLGDCPYKDKRKYCGRLTFSRAFQNAWRDGWEYAHANREQALISVKYGYFYARGAGLGQD